MNNPTPSAPRTGGGFWGRWSRFWFQPTDPTTLGFIRIITGLVIFYVHLVYCFDLYNFFGPKAWFGLEEINRERREAPFVAAPLNWDDQRPTLYLPEAPHRREAIMDFLRELPDGFAARERKLAYLDRYIIRAQNPLQFQQAVQFVEVVGTDEYARDKRLALLTREKYDPNEPPRGIPDFVAAMPLEERLKFRGEVIDFLSAMPAQPEPFAYVLAFFTVDMDDAARARAGRFMYNMPVPDSPQYKQMSEMLADIKPLPEDPVKRAKVLEYLDYWGRDPNQVYDFGRPIFSVWFHVTDPTGMALVHAGVLVIIFLFTVGFCTRVTAVLTWLAAVGYIHRSQQVLFGMDTMMNILLIYLMIGGAGGALSVDRLIARYRAVRASLRRSGRLDAQAQAVLAGPRPSVSANLAVRLIQVHFCFIYMASGLSKLKGNMWWDHTAIWMTIANPEFSMIWFGPYEWALRHLVELRVLFSVVLTLGVFFTLVMEIGLPFLVWTRLRPYMVVGGVLLHAGISITMGLVMFSLLMMTMLLSYVPAAVIRERVAWAVDLVPSLRLRFNGRSRKQARVASLVKAVDLANQVELVDQAPRPAEAKQPVPEVAGGHVQLVEANGKVRTGYGIFARLMRSLKLLRSFAFVLWIPGVGAIGRSRWPEGHADALAVPSPAAGPAPAVANGAGGSKPLAKR